LLHLAWYTVPGRYWTSAENLRWVQSSLGLLQAFSQHGGQRVVMAGTCAEYDWQHGLCSESVTPLSPTTLYGICKHSLQLMLTAFSKETKLSAAWGRIFFAFGPHEAPDRLVAYVIQSLLQKKPARCSHGNQARDFLYVQDVADAFVTLVESEVSGPINIASGRPTVLRDVIGKIGELLHQPDLIQLGAQPAPEHEPPLLVADVGRLTKEVGWTPQYDLTSGLERTIEWWKGRMADGKHNWINECPLK
jgi:nucleoside-diphosphate-sugar epimerase